MEIRCLFVLRIFESNFFTGLEDVFLGRIQAKV
jgi:hypothetical protein